MAKIWGVEWLVVEEDGKQRIPAFEFLAEVPPAVRLQLLSFVEAVRRTGPERWRDTESHCPMHGDCSHMHEVRDRHDQTLYRLYLVWDRDEHHAVLVDGRIKTNNTKFPPSEYKKIGALGTLATSGTDALATTDDMTRLALEYAAKAKANEERAIQAERDLEDLLGS